MSSSGAMSQPHQPYEYMPIANSRMRTASAPTSTMMNMMNNYSSSYVSPNVPSSSSMYANTGGYAHDNRLYSSHAQPTQYHTNDIPMNLSHKRVLDDFHRESGGSSSGRRETWKNESPVSVTARLFRNSQLSGSHDQHMPPHHSNEPYGMSQSEMASDGMHQDAYKSNISQAYRTNMAQNAYNSMDTVS